MGFPVVLVGYSPGLDRTELEQLIVRSLRDGLVGPSQVIQRGYDPNSYFAQLSVGRLLEGQVVTLNFPSCDSAESFCDQAGRLGVRTEINVQVVLSGPSQLRPDDLEKLIRCFADNKRTNPQKCVDEILAGRDVSIPFSDLVSSESFCKKARKTGIRAEVRAPPVADRETTVVGRFVGVVFAILFGGGFYFGAVWLWLRLLSWLVHGGRGGVDVPFLGTAHPIWCVVGFIGLPILLISPIVELYREKKKSGTEASKRITACRHGIAGALHGFIACANCETEKAIEAEVNAELQRRLKEQRGANRDRIAAEITERRRRQAEEAKAKKETARREWLRNIRLPRFLQDMHPHKFELLICELFRKLGYDVEETPYSGDSGCDGILRKADEHLILQCKRTQKKIGEPIVRDLYGTMHGEGANGGVLVTTGSVSDQARLWLKKKAKERRIRVIELDELTKLIRDHFGEDDVVPDEFIVADVEMPEPPTRRAGHSDYY